MSYANISIDATSDVVAHHCDHDDGTVSVRLTPLSEELVVYLNGSPAQLTAVAYRLLRVVDDLETAMVETATRSTSDLG